jgi:hypothetical protein
MGGGGGPEVYERKAVEMGVCYHRGPRFREHGGGRTFPRAFERRVSYFNLFSRRTFVEEF